jgi:preprotein translocase SecE subunit
MAKQRDNGSNRGGSYASGAAVADKESDMADAAFNPSRDEGRDSRPLSSRGSEPPTRGPTDGGGGGGAEGGGFFDIYKAGQGYYTRIWSGVAYGVLVLWCAQFLYVKCEVIGQGTTTRYVQVGVAVATILGFGLAGYWALALNRRVCDFLIATEGEMKKVNWTSRKEIIGSTKVVIFVLLAMGALLFVVDVFFMLFFNWIGILKGGSLLDAFWGMFK